MENIEELELSEDVETHKNFYIGVSYGETGTVPYAYLFENMEYLTLDYDKIYKIKVPYRINDEK